MRRSRVPEEVMYLLKSPTPRLLPGRAGKFGPRTRAKPAALGPGHQPDEEFASLMRCIEEELQFALLPALLSGPGRQCEVVLLFPVLLYEKAHRLERELLFLLPSQRSLRGWQLAPHQAFLRRSYIVNSVAGYGLGWCADDARKAHLSEIGPVHGWPGLVYI